MMMVLIMAMMLNIMMIAVVMRYGGGDGNGARGTPADGRTWYPPINEYSQPIVHGVLSIRTIRVFSASYAYYPNSSGNLLNAMHVTYRKRRFRRTQCMQPKKFPPNAAHCAFELRKTSVPAHILC